MRTNPTFCRGGKKLFARLTRSGNGKQLNGCWTSSTRRRGSAATHHTYLLNSANSSESANTPLYIHTSNPPLFQSCYSNSKQSYQTGSWSNNRRTNEAQYERGRFRLNSNGRMNRNRSSKAFGNSTADRRDVRQNNSLKKLRSRSPALPFVSKKKKKGMYGSNDLNDPEEEEISVAQAELMYTRATWRMYERITTFRAAAAAAQQQNTQRFCMPAAQTIQATVDRADSPLNHTGQFGTTVDFENGQMADPRSLHVVQQQTNTGHPVRCASNLSADRHHICFEMDND